MRASGPFDPSEFFLLAQALLQETPEESQARTAISRAYYACFLTLRDRMFGLDERLLTRSVRNRIVRAANRREAGEHEVVILAIAQNRNISSSGRAKNLTDAIRELKDLRVQADYKLDPSDMGTQTSYSRYGVANWAELAHQAISLTALLLPDLRRVPQF